MIWIELNDCQVLVMKISELLQDFTIYRSNEENELLEKIKGTVKLSSLPLREQVVADRLIRKSLLTKIGFDDPMIRVNHSTW